MCGCTIPPFPSPSSALLYTASFFLAISYITIIKYRAWYFSVVVVGAAIEVVAYVTRTYSAKNQTELGPFVMTLTLTVLAPVFIAAGNYMLISRLILAVLPPSRHRVLKIPGRRLSPVFVFCDIVAFLVQGSGSGIAGSNNWRGDEERIGRYVLVGGLAFQFIAFSLFLRVFRRFHVLANRHEVGTAPAGWRNVVLAVYISSLLIMVVILVTSSEDTAEALQVRCIFRIAEFSEGLDGYAFRKEWLFWVFEALPMAPAIAIFCLYHPSPYLGKYGAWRLQRDPKPSDPSEMIDPRDSA